MRAFKVAFEDIAEVVICFDNYVFRGCRAQKKDERKFDAFESPAFFPLAHITEEILLSGFEKKRKKDCEDINFKNDFSDGILQLSLIPGGESELIEELIYNEKCKGFVLQSFGAGNVPNDKRYSWIPFIEKAKRHNKPVLITSQFPANATLHTAYEPGIKAIEAGAIPTGNMTSACATAKFRWVLAQVDKENLAREKKFEMVKNMMNTSYVGEVDIIDEVHQLYL